MFYKRKKEIRFINLYIFIEGKILQHMPHLRETTKSTN